MSIQDAKTSAEAILALINDNEKISLQVFAAKLARASAAYPEDQTIGVMSGVVEKMADAKFSITRKEIKELYNKLYSRNTKFASIFKDELGQKEETVNERKSLQNETVLSTKDFAEKVVDPLLSNALQNAFGVKTPGYSKVQADRARDVCINTFALAGLTPEVAIETGTEEAIVCRASFETPRGTTSVLVPIEFIANKPLKPEVFVSNAGAMDITREEIKNHLISRAGEKLNITAALVLETLANSHKPDISNVDLALTKLNALKEKSSENDYQGQILAQKLNEEELAVKTPVYRDRELETIADQMENSFGVATFRFGANRVDAARKLIERKLSAFGLNNYQMSVSNSTDNSVSYAVSLNNGRVAFTVPVKIEGGKVFEPNVLISSGSMDNLSYDTINKLFTYETGDTKIAAIASHFATYKANELVDIVKKASEVGEFGKAEDALNVLHEMGNEEVYQEAFAKYQDTLSGNKVAASQCSMIVKSSSSQQLLCGHTGLPLSKVYQKNGDCLPKYRQNMPDTYEGAYLQNHKIFF